MKSEKGQALLELAFVLPLLMVFLCGMVDFARAYYLKNQLANAASLAARTAVVTPTLSVQTPITLSAASTAPAAAVKGTYWGGGITNDMITYEVQNLDTTQAAQSGNRVKVILSCQSFHMITPFYKMAAILSGTSPSQCTDGISISGEATMRYE